MLDRSPSSALQGTPPLRLRLLATTDVHGHLRAFDYYADRADPDRGLSLAATLAERLRTEADVTLLLDNGDFLQGTPLTEFAARETDGLHPVIGAMNRMGYDAAALGNHEFDYGLPYLEGAIAGARFPVLCANVLRSETGAPFATPWTMLERPVAGREHPLRIGLLGLAPPQIAAWTRRSLDHPLETRPILETAAALVPEMRAAGADVVVALCHSGIGASDENAATEVARLAGIDAMIVGHTHRVFPGFLLEGAGIDAREGTLYGVPAVEPGANASHLGVIDLRLEARPEGGWTVAGHEVAARPVSEAGRDENPEVLGATRSAHAATCRHIRSPLGEILVPLQSYFAQLGPCAAMGLLAEAKRAHAAPRLAEAGLQDLPVLVAVAPARTGGRGGPGNYVDIPAGPLAARHASQLYPYPNRVCAIELTGAEVADWLERSAAQFRRITPGVAGQSLVDPAVPGFSVDALDGVSYAIDVSQPSRYDAEGMPVGSRRGRIQDLRHDGRPVRDDDRFIVVTNSFRLGGGGTVRAATGKRDLIDGAPTRTAIEDYLRDNGPLAPRPGGGWRLTPLAEPTEVIFHTGPGARAYLAESPLPLSPLDETPEGFLGFALTL